MIYFDNSATTPMDTRVIDKIKPYLKDLYGNPSSKYYDVAVQCKHAVDESRKNVSELLNCNPNEIIFTSGASESNNFIIKGVMDTYSDKGNHIVTSIVEHKSVLETCKYMGDKGYDVSYVGVNSEGNLDIDELKSELGKDTVLTSIMWGNNETGVVNDIETICSIVKSKDIFFHTDATQVIGKVPVDLKKIPVDFLSLSGHKICGPKGIGATFIRSDEFGIPLEVTPLIHGGGQEYGYRSGTHNVPFIVGLGEAFKIAKEEMDEYIPKILELEHYLLEKLKKYDIKLNGNLKNKIPGVLNISIPGLNNEIFIKKIKDEFAISTGSACSLGEPSYVLDAMGKSREDITSCLRISLNKFNKKEEIDLFIQKLDHYLN
ncbi:cysteine desulfurase family protein [Methanococcus maripaludis]|uniref:Cysteine desulfurase n=1 Tax=Methanococcus maripaludis TaxID=39152 RepID=A0A7J9PMN1_METMI|nr:cysteine desulfurase family protein [Methanococcus maripaludis]MBA2864034.1 cysteine desulfurase [Methanococcus maripaludis]